MRKVTYITTVYDFSPNDLSTIEPEAKISKFNELINNCNIITLRKSDVVESRYKMFESCTIQYTHNNTYNYWVCYQNYARNACTLEHKSSAV
jgi:hypothetical protein